jgi:hypothetical protein
MIILTRKFGLFREQRYDSNFGIARLAGALRHVGDKRQTAGRKYLYAPLRGLDFLTSVLRLLVVYRSMDLMREWRRARNEKSLVAPMTTELAPVSRLTRGLQQLGHCEQKTALLCP